MIFGALLKLNVPGLDIDHNLVEKVSGVKLIGVRNSNNLSCNLHVDQCSSALSEKVKAGWPP